MDNYNNKFIFHSVDHVRAHVPAYDMVNEAFGVEQADRFAQALVDKAYPVRPYVSLIAAFEWCHAAKTLECGLVDADFNKASRNYSGTIGGYKSVRSPGYRESIDRLRRLGSASEVDYETGEIIKHAPATLSPAIVEAAKPESPSPLSKDYQVGGDHYSKLTIQPWDVMRETMSHEAFCGFLHGNVIKYVMRDKNGVEDFKKAQHYLSVLIAEIEGDDGQA